MGLIYYIIDYRLYYKERLHYTHTYIDSKNPHRSRILGRIPEDNSDELGDNKTGYKFRLQRSLSQQIRET